MFQLQLRDYKKILITLNLSYRKKEMKVKKIGIC